MWEEAASVLRIPADKLLPSDRFDKELKEFLVGYPFVDLNDDFVDLAVRTLRRNELDSRVLDDVKTLGDYVCAVGRKRGSARGLA